MFLGSIVLIRFSFQAIGSNGFFTRPFSGKKSQ
jgi:hypothetical protein